MRGKLRFGLGLFFCTQALWALPHDPPTVFSEKITTQPIFDLLTYPARVDSKVNATVLAETDGVISKILKPLGSKVRRGEAIAVLKHIDPVYQYAPMMVVAPVAGVVNQVLVTDGALVNKGDKLISITDPNQLRIMIEVAAQDVRSIHAGLKADFFIANRNEPLMAEVKGLSPSVDPMLGTATCELALSKTGEKNLLAPGMIGRMQFKVNQRQGILLMDFAVFYKGDDTFVRIIENGHAKSVPVKLGEKHQAKVEVLSGLKAGDEVIDRASGFVADGDQVKVEKAR